MPRAARDECDYNRMMLRTSELRERAEAYRPRASSSTWPGRRVLPVAPIFMSVAMTSTADWERNKQATGYGNPDNARE
jgi:hypothetical protein